MNHQGLFLKCFRGRRVTITGGLGFIGSNLAHALVQLGAKVTLIDSLIPEYGGNLRNIEAIKRRVRVNISDVRNNHALPHLLKDQDFLFNLAGQTSHLDSMSAPDIDLEINCRSQLSILEVCRKHNPDIRVVFASTRQIYGRPLYLPVDEKHPLQPVDINGINKLAGEQYHLLYSQVHGIKSTVLRLTNTIGPRMRVKDARQTFVGIWIKQVLSGEPFEVWGGQQLRDFTFVDDAVEAFLLAASRPEAVGAVFNLGGLGRVSLAGLAKMLVAAAGGGEYTMKEYPAERKKIDIGDFFADDALIGRKLGWKPRTKIREALERTVEFYRAELPHYL